MLHHWRQQISSKIRGCTGGVFPTGQSLLLEVQVVPRTILAGSQLTPEFHLQSLSSALQISRTAPALSQQSIKHHKFQCTKAP